MVVALAMCIHRGAATGQQLRRGTRFFIALADNG
jgi:hypothetical protein